MDVTVGRWRARFLPPAQAEAAFALRAKVFRGGADDRDPFDARAGHLLIEREGEAVACARLSVQSAEEMRTGYTGQSYDLAAFSERFSRALEVGRVCLRADVRDVEVPRLLLGALARVAMAERVAVLYGCLAFPEGARTGLLMRHLAPRPWAPARTEGSISLSRRPGPLSPLVQSYLALGAVVSDHAVADSDLRTLHVFAALPVADVPVARLRRLTEPLRAA